MVLMGVVISVRQNQIRIEAVLQRLKPPLDLFPLSGKKSIFKRQHLDVTGLRALQKRFRRFARFPLSLAAPAQNTPKNIEFHPRRYPMQERGACADFDVVGMGAETQDGKPI